MAAAVDDEQLEERPLPSYAPLSHDTPLLAPSHERSFDVNAFLLSRASHNSLPELRAELRDYLAVLKSELVQLINDDYESFISLSTELRGEGTRLHNFKQPLANLQSGIKSSRDELHSIQRNVQEKLQQRAQLREAKSLLHLLLRLSDTTGKLEDLLNIKPESRNAYQPHSELTPEGGDASLVLVEERSSIKYLTRVASEYAQLGYLAHKAQAAGCHFVDVLAPRMSNIQQKLLHDLSSLFASSLSLKATSQHEQSTKTSKILEMLKIYDVLGQQSAAELVMREQIMTDFVRKTIFSTSLVTPASPIIPSTPLTPRTVIPRSPLSPNVPLPPQFIGSSNPNDLISTILSNETTPLASFYNNILRFLLRELRPILVMTEHLNSTRPNRPEGESFHVLSNVIWEELGSAIMDELGTVIFAVGRPDEFHKNYLATQTFIQSLESLSPSAVAILSLRDHKIFQAFERRWQLSVYFQLRWKEIVGQVEELLDQPIKQLHTIHGSKNLQHRPGSQQALACQQAMSRCWDDDVYIDHLSWRFWRLTLQIILRYQTWVQITVIAGKPAIKTSPASRNPPLAISRSSTPTPQTGMQEQTNLDDPAQDENRLKRAACLIKDHLALCASALNLWSSCISHALPFVEDGDGPLESILQQALSAGDSLVKPLATESIAILSREACDTLQALRQIPSQYRAMTSRRLPSRPSDYVSLVLKPVKSFFGVGIAGEGVGSALTSHYLVEWSTEVFHAVVARFTSLLSTMRKHEESLRRLKKGKKSTFSLFGGASVSAASSDENIDGDRVRTQVILDVQALGLDAVSLGIDVEKVEGFHDLQILAASRYDDEA